MALQAITGSRQVTGDVPFAEALSAVAKKCLIQEIRDQALGSRD
jgi:hypothetical protein